MSSRLNLLVGGPKELYPAHWQRLAGQFAGVDRGSLHLLEAGITPLFAVGDFDSLTQQEFQQVQAKVKAIHQAPAEKDETDTEMAVKLAFQTYQADKVLLIGATGGRLDHLLANLFLPAEPRFQPQANHIELLDAQNWVRFFSPGSHQLQPNADYPYLGIVPLTAVSDLNIEGAKYPLSHWSSQTPFSWVSNEFLGQAPITISWQRGIVAAIYSRDRVGQKRDN